MGHGDRICISDSNFPSDSIAESCVIKIPIRIRGKTSELVKDILTLFPLDQYVEKPVGVMDRVDSDKDKNLEVIAYSNIAKECGIIKDNLNYIERFEFYEVAKKSFVILQTDDHTLYANTILQKGVM
jgi:L-fucose mutarotase